MPTTWQEQYERMRPTVLRQLSYILRRLPAERREDATVDCEALACVALERLWAKGKGGQACATHLARYAVSSYRAGRRVGARLNRNDIANLRAQRFHGVCVKQTLDWLAFHDNDDPAETARVKLDFEQWLTRLKRREARIVTALANQQQGKLIAYREGISPGRLSQIRKTLEILWDVYYADLS